MINRANNWIVLKRVCAVVAALGWSLCASAQANKLSYKLMDLGVVGPAGQPFQITNNGIITGAVETPDGTADHAVIYFHHQMFDISKPGLGGANSEAIGINGWGQVVGGANNSPNADPQEEDFCGFQTLGISTATASCLPFLWQQGRMIPLPTLSDNHGNHGDNGVAVSINDFGVVAGAAENTTIDCPTYDPAAFQFQKYQFKPVLWGRHGIEELATVGGDPVGSAKVVNNKGQAVGATGTCSVFGLVFPFPMQPLHAVLWEQDGAPIDLGSLGGNEKSLWGNFADGINNSGHVVGSSSLSDNVTIHAFFWSRETGRMQDLGPIKNKTKITNSLGLAINDSDDVVGSSLDFATQFVATIWKHGVATDLNTLIPTNSPLHLMFGCWINSSGHIIGVAVDGSGLYHGYELIPTDEWQR